MATQLGFSIESTLASKHLLDSDNIKGGYYTVDNVNELNSLPKYTNSSDGIIVEGCLAYVKTLPTGGTSHFYYYENDQWNELVFSGSSSSVDWSDITNKPTLFSGSYNDLSDKPTIPTNTNQLTNGAGFITSSGTASNVSGIVAIDNGGTGATTRLDALKNLTSEDVSTSAQYFLTITDNWNKGGYTSVDNVKKVLGLGSAAYTASTAYAAASHGTHVPSTCTTVTDWNDATSIGWYMGHNITNAPSSGWYFGYVIAHNTNYVYQEVYQFTFSTDAKVIPKYIRAKMDSIWGEWTNVTVAKVVPSNAMFTDTNTTYSAGTGLSLSGTTFSLKVWTGTLSQYNALSSKDSSTLYLISD